MYSTEHKKVHYFYNGVFYTRKLNGFVDDILFEKIYGGASLLKKIKKIAKNKNINFSSSMINENLSRSWLNSGWEKNHTLNICVLNLKNLSTKTQVLDKRVEIKKFNHGDIEDLLRLDHKIFDPYWRNSLSSFIETMKSCNNNYLFKIGENESTSGYAILGETRKFTYLQRIGVKKNSQGLGLGDMLLKAVINFSIDKKFINIKLNTQKDNNVALSLYKKNNFEVSPRKLVIMKTS
jgi:ribosomal protein S18 acetylase RimI-like enzyme